jgi:DNA-binding IclR family transcriptional regulator
MSEPIPEELVRFLQDRVASLEQLETLLLLRRTRDRVWGLTDVAQRLSMPESSIEPVLVELTRHGMLASHGTGIAKTWQYSPASPELAALIERLAVVYDDRRLEIMRMLSAQAMERIRDSAAKAFADAFVIGRKKDG